MPDIALPTSADIEKIGERALPYALPLKSIKAAKYQPSGDVNAAGIAALREQHQVRMQSLPALKRYADYTQREIAERDRSDWSLNLAERQRQYQEWRDYIQDYSSSQTAELPALKADAKRLEAIEKRNAVIDDEADKEYFAPDAALFEALHILFDFIQQPKAVPMDKAA